MADAADLTEQQLLDSSLDSSCVWLDQWDQQAQLLQQRLQPLLTEAEVLWNCPIETDSGVDLTPTLAIASKTAGVQTIHWALDIDPPQIDPPQIDPPKNAAVSTAHTASQFFARSTVAEYWSLDTAQVELRTYRLPQANEYQQQQLFCVGQQLSIQAFPHITLQVQEPLPLYFLTRTTNGQRTYSYTQLPLKLLI
ncbi:MAG: hypothetical protein AAFN12_06970 [Cyanobacteria bacterium J06560_2]